MHKQLRVEMERRLSQFRFFHCLGVAETAKRLAEMYGCCPKKAEIAGLCHDVAREIPIGEQVKMAHQFGVRLEQDELRCPIVIHAFVGVEVIRRELGIDDRDILQAVRRHVTGAPNMSVLDSVVYVSDMIEPGRDFPGVDELRSISNQSLTDALKMCLQTTVSYLRSQGKAVHRHTLAAAAQFD